MKLFLICALGLTPLLGFAAAENTQPSPRKDEKTNVRQVTNPKINCWVEGTVKSVSPKDGTFEVHGMILPFATAHAQVESDMQKKIDSEPNPSKDKVDEFHKQAQQDLKNRLSAAEKEKASQIPQDFSLHEAPNGQTVVLNQDAVGEMITLRRDALGTAGEKSTTQGGKPEWRGEVDLIGVYEVPQDVSYGEPNRNNSSLKPLNDIISGDKVLVGFDSKTNQTFSIIKELAQ